MNNKEAAQAGGITIAGIKYFAVNVDDGKFRGKKGVSESTYFTSDIWLTSRLQPDGCVVVKTKQAILVTTHSAPTQLAESATIVESLGDYLTGVGY